MQERTPEITEVGVVLFQPSLASKPWLWLGLRQLWLSKSLGQATAFGTNIVPSGKGQWLYAAEVVNIWMLSRHTNMLTSAVWHHCWSTSHPIPSPFPFLYPWGTCTVALTGSPEFMCECGHHGGAAENEHYNLGCMYWSKPECCSWCLRIQFVLTILAVLVIPAMPLLSMSLCL